jgi:hypothetical protein
MLRGWIEHDQFFISDAYHLLNLLLKRGIEGKICFNRKHSIRLFRSPNAKVYIAAKILYFDRQPCCLAIPVAVIIEGGLCGK